jgi:hypothetical protein
MVVRAFWHTLSTEVLARVALAVGAAVLGSLGLYVSSPVITTVAAITIFLLVYRLRYKRL